MDVAAPSVNALVTVGGASVVTMILAEVLKRAWHPTPAQQDRFMPLIAVVLGVGVALVGTWALGLTDHVSLVQAGITGLFAGVGSSGLYDVVHSNT